MRKFWQRLQGRGGHRLQTLRGVGLGLTALVALLWLRIGDPLPVEIVRVRAFDMYQTLKPRAQSDSIVKIVDIDEESLAQLGQWPWPRTIVAELLLKIFQNGGVVVGFDIVFAEPDRMSPPALANYLGGLDEDAKAYLRSLPDSDDVFADMIARTRVVVGRGVTDAPKKDQTAGDDGEITKRYRAAFAKKGKDPDAYVPAYRQLVTNLSRFENIAAGQGVYTLRQESDAIVRRIPALYKVGDDLMPSLSLEILRAATGDSTIVISTNEAGIDSVIVGRVKIPTDGSGRIWLYSSPRAADRFVSAKAVLDGKIEPGTLSGKIVLIGTTAVGLRDFWSMPVNGSVPGVEIHAQLIESMLAQSFLDRPNFALGAELFLTAFAALLVLILTPRLGSIRTMIFGAILLSAMVGTSWYLFAEKRQLLDITYPLFSSFALFLSIVFMNYIREERSKNFVRSAFAQYLAPSIVKQLSEKPEELRLGGETRDMTILFSDVRGFTALSEKYKEDPNVVTELISSLLTPLADVILAEEGTIDKFMGDCVMAFWNAPIQQNDHPFKTCTSAVKMLTALDGFNADRAQSQPDWEPLRLGIGINSGTCVVGNMGTPQRFDYTVMGDAVNLAARLEGLSSLYGFKAILGEDTAVRVREQFALLELDLIAVKGKQQAVRVFGLVGDIGVRENQRFRELETVQQAMLATYRNRDWAKTLDYLAQLRSFEWIPETFCELYEERVNAFTTEPPPDNWDGVFVAEIK